MKLLWEAMHRFAAEAELHVVLSNPLAKTEMRRQKAPRVAPLEDLPVLQSESDHHFCGEPLLPDDNLAAL